MRARIVTTLGIALVLVGVLVMPVTAQSQFCVAYTADHLAGVTNARDYFNASTGSSLTVAQYATQELTAWLDRLVAERAAQMEANDNIREKYLALDDDGKAAAAWCVDNPAACATAAGQ